MKPEDFMPPRGDLEPELFPAGDLEARISAYIGEAQQRGETPEAIRAWVYYRAFQAALLIHSLAPQSESVEGYSYSRGNLNLVPLISFWARLWATLTGKPLPILYGSRIARIDATF